MQVTWYFAEYEPSISSDCTGQDYFANHAEQWTTPANGP